MELLDPRKGWRRIDAVRTTGIPNPQSPAKKIKTSLRLNRLKDHENYHQSSFLTIQPCHLESVGVDYDDYFACSAPKFFYVDQAEAIVEHLLAELDALVLRECPASYHSDSAAMKDNYYC